MLVSGLRLAGGGGPVALGARIARSGEGEVWETGDPGLYAKLYHDPDERRIAKLRTMLAHPPQDPMRPHGHSAIAWPVGLVERGGVPAGFLMPAVRDAASLTALYNPKLRQRRAPGFEWYCLHAAAHNAAWIVRALHAAGYVVGDLKTDNLLARPDGLVSIIDTDSFQVPDPATGLVHRCPVGTEGFTPPELIGRELGTIDRTELHDRFGLAVIVHLLLFGYHPFQGQWTGPGEPPPLAELIRIGELPYAPASRLAPGPLAIGLDCLHPGLEEAFRRAFVRGHAAPRFRPSAAEWCGLLAAAITDLVPCPEAEMHVFSRRRGACPWCRRKAALGHDVFPPVADERVPRAVFVQRLAAGLAAGDDRAVARLWTRLPWLRGLPEFAATRGRADRAAARAAALDRILAAWRDLTAAAPEAQSAEAEAALLRLWRSAPDLAGSGAAATLVDGRPLAERMAGLKQRDAALGRLRTAIAAARSGGRLTLAGEAAVAEAFEAALPCFAERPGPLLPLARRGRAARQRLEAWQAVTAALEAGDAGRALAIWRESGALLAELAPAATLPARIAALARSRRVRE